MQCNSVQSIKKVGVYSNNRLGKKHCKKISQNHLGWLYQNGYGVEKNYSVAFDCYKKSADQNDAKAQNNLGYMYEHGLGIAENTTLAIEWYMKSANQGYAEAQYNLGYMYEIGKGVAENMQLAIEWYQKAAVKGNPEAQYNLGLIYENGDVVSEDLDVALDWYKKAAIQQNADAQYRLGLIFDKGIGVIEDVILAAKWYEKAAYQGHEEAQYSLGTFYEDGRGGVNKSRALAKMWYQKSAVQGHKLAQLKLNEDTITHKFNYSLKINDQFYNDYEDICYTTFQGSIVLTITYIGSIDIGNNIIISEKINNPYQALSQHVTTESDTSRYCGDCSKIINIWYSCILSCLGMQRFATSDNNSQDKLDINKMKSNQFWKQKIEEKLKEAKHLVDKIIEQKYGLEVSSSLIEEPFQRIATEQQYNFPGTCSINNDGDLLVQSVQDDSKDSLVLPKKEDNPLKFRSPIFNRYRYT